MGFSIGSSSANMGPRRAIREFGDEVEGSAFNLTVIVRLLEFVRPYGIRMSVAFTMMIISSLLTLLIPYLVKVAIDEPIANGDADGLNEIALIMITALSGLYIASSIQRYLLSWVGQRVLADLRSALFNHLQALHLGYHDTHIVGVTISRVINDVAVINQLLSQGLITLVGDVLLLAGIIIVMISMSWQLALITYIVLPLMILATALFARRAKRAFRETRARVAAVVGELAENIAGMRVIQAFTQETTTRDKFDDVNRDNRDAHVTAMSLAFVFLPSVEFLGMLATGIVLWAGGLAVADGELTVGILVAFLAYVTRFFQPIQEMSQLYTTMQAAMAGGERVLELLDTAPAVADEPDAIIMPPIEGHIEFKDVSFAYSPGIDVLHNINLVIEPGQTIALVGPTGAGKTSIGNLIARFYDVTDGAILVDGIDIRQVTQRSYRRQFGLVSQDPFLFPGTLAENIAYGSPDASQTAIESAAQAANAHEFIRELPDQYQTMILEDSVNLSVGQRQLVSIARAILADPRILIMDEATANVDTVTEGLVQEALERLLQDRTAIVIAHRLGTIVNADCIYVIDEGRIVAQGKHEELLQLSELYHELYENQFVTALSE